MSTEHSTQILAFAASRSPVEAENLCEALRLTFSSSPRVSFRVVPTDIVVGFTTDTYPQTIENLEDHALYFCWGFVAGWQEGQKKT